jgi:hypothetical protein
MMRSLSLPSPYHTFQPCESVEVLCSAPHDQIRRHQIAYAARYLVQSLKQPTKALESSTVRGLDNVGKKRKIRRLCGVHGTQNLILTSSEDFFSFILIVRIYLHPLIELTDLLSPKQDDCPSAAFRGICSARTGCSEATNRSASQQMPSRC